MVKAHAASASSRAAPLPPGRVATKKKAAPKVVPPPAKAKSKLGPTAKSRPAQPYSDPPPHLLIQAAQETDSGSDDHWSPDRVDAGQGGQGSSQAAPSAPEVTLPEQARQLVRLRTYVRSTHIQTVQRHRASTAELRASHADLRVSLEQVRAENRNLHLTVCRQSQLLSSALMRLTELEERFTALNERLDLGDLD